MWITARLTPTLPRPVPVPLPTNKWQCHPPCHGWAADRPAWVPVWYVSKTVFWDVNEISIRSMKLGPFFFYLFFTKWCQKKTLQWFENDKLQHINKYELFLQIVLFSWYLWKDSRQESPDIFLIFFLNQRQNLKILNTKILNIYNYINYVVLLYFILMGFYYEIAL